MKMELSIGGQTVTWDSDQHPYWPPIDSNGQIIGDVPWKFFDPERTGDTPGSREDERRG